MDTTFPKIRKPFRKKANGARIEPRIPPVLGFGIYPNNIQI